MPVRFEGHVNKVPGAVWSDASDNEHVVQTPLSGPSSREGDRLQDSAEVTPVQDIAQSRRNSCSSQNRREDTLTPSKKPDFKPALKRSNSIALDKGMMTKLSEDDRKILAELDGDLSGEVEITEVLALVRKHRDNKKATSRLFQVFILAVLIFVLLLGGNTIATFAVVENSKESNVKGDMLVAAGTGKPLETANSDMSVDANGMLITKASSRRLGGEGDSLKTQPTMKKTELASSLPDSVLMGLDEVTVYSDKGHTLQIQVNGFSRVPVLNSNCGNVVHFYTAWKGRITLDSKDLSFDEATAKEFKNAGFSIAVGGMGGRRLAGTSKTDGFFKHMEGMQASGSWKCAGVPLPTMSKLNIREETTYQPCGAVADPKKQKSEGDLCDSRYGGQVPGADVLASNHALAVVSKTARISAMLKKKDPQVIYVKSSSTSLRSPKYEVQILTYPNHIGQEKITITERETAKIVSFQVIAKQGRSHCTAAATDAATKSSEAAQKDSNVESDMHFEFLGTFEEGGRVLRHFRMMTSDAFNQYMGADGKRPTDSYTEYWDVAETLAPYRMLSGDGSLTVYKSIVGKCSDADVQAAIDIRIKTPVADLMTCSEQDAESQNRPDMDGPFQDLDEEGADFYTSLNFGTSEDMAEVADATDDVSDKAVLARYLVKTGDQMAMPDFCYAHCKTAIEALKVDMQNGVKLCAASMPNALDCMDNSGKSQCMSSQFYSNHRLECADPANASSRRMSDDEVNEAEAVPVRYLSDGEYQADANTLPPSLQKELISQFGEDVFASARLIFNGTERAKKTNAMYDKLSLDDALIAQKRNLIRFECNSVNGKTKWMGDGWCMQWDFNRFGFTLMIKWGFVGGEIGIAITCEACVPILLVFSIPPPLKVEFCVGGKLSVLAKWACPQIPLTIKGKVYWTIRGKVDFGIVSINLAQLEMGISAEATNRLERCYWLSGEGQRRRRFWSRRRRRTRKCNYSKECDVKVSAYVELTLGSVKARVELAYWVRKKVFDVILTFEAFEFWKLMWGGWKELYSTRIARYNFSPGYKW